MNASAVAVADVQQAPSAYSITACRSCGSRDLTVVLDLGLQPLANDLPATIEEGTAQAVFPLEVMFCDGCGLLQVSETIPPDLLFGKDYPYYSSVIPALLAHSKEHVDALIAERGLGSEDLVVEIASNDGYLLKNFVDAGISVLGIDPATGPVAAATAAGVPTMHAFFGAEVARGLRAEGKSASVMLANNVLAHVTDVNDFVEGFAILLADDGIIEFEFPYVRELVERCAFDTIYHEHVFYYSLSALIPLFARHGLHMNDARLIEIHGGSLRLRVSKRPGRSSELDRMLKEEREIGIDRLGYYERFGQRVQTLGEALRQMLATIVAEGKTIAAYGAAAKGATLLNFLKLPPGTIGYVVDRNIHKVGRYMPGVLLPIRNVSELETAPPDYLLILPWNFAHEIVEQQRAFAERGGTFLRPIPWPKPIGLG